MANPSANKVMQKAKGRGKIMQIGGDYNHSSSINIWASLFGVLALGGLAWAFNVGSLKDSGNPQQQQPQPQQLPQQQQQSQSQPSQQLLQVLLQQPQQPQQLLQVLQLPQQQSQLQPDPCASPIANSEQG